MKRLLLVFILLLLFVPAKASHIVGGEFELLWISGNTYRVNMILYYDDLLGETGGDASVTIRFFRKRDNAIILNSLTLFPISDTPVEYFQPECSDGSIETGKVVYTTTVELSPAIYNDPDGYYMAWERCCRNYVINNIYSENPNAGGTRIAGQTFYLEFPPVIKNGVPFVNSSPRLFPPLSDYACPDRRYYVDFAGTDPDGDSLVYSIVTPLSTVEPTALPTGGLPHAGPYPEILWKPGFSLDNIMNGNPDLEISYDGLLTVTPSFISVGLYVFAVKCEEFRNGEKIGEVRRDFQMLVQSACPVAEPPQIVGRGPDDSDFGLTGNLSVTYDNTVSDEERCFEVKISDPDALKFDDGFQENVRIRAIPIGFRKDISEVLPIVTTATVTNDGTAIFNICLPRCPYQSSGVFQIGIVAFDDACTLPLSDTLIVTVNLELPVNAPPQFDNSGNGTEIIEVISEGGTVATWPFQVTDPDGDLISYRLVPVDFNLADFGMTFTEPLSGTETGPINKILSWDPKCDVYDFTEKSTFELFFIVEDLDACSIIQADTTHLQLSITDFSQITPPVIDNSVLSNADTIEVSVQMNGEPLEVEVTGTDIDNTLILLRGKGIGFDASTYGILFPGDFDQGFVQSKVTWQLTCDTLDYENGNVFHFQMMVVDSLNKCKFYKADTLVMQVTVEPPPEKNEFLPPNVFTPNASDDLNSFFAMVREEDGEFVSILPNDDCFGKFVSIQIYNRWGKQVYESLDRNFKWYGEGMPVGVYYYFLKYSNKDYKGTVSIQF
jgi:hypothetical protein